MTRLILVGGFLGAGKTTALAALAVRLRERGLSVGVVTNDLAADLVDTASLRAADLPVTEVAGGCFCCRFPDLVTALQTASGAGSAIPADVLLAEPVGSCTDLWATVLAPLRRYHANAFSVAPFTILADPERIRECVLEEKESTFAPEVAYIYRKQLEEADRIALTKADTLPAEETARLVSALTEQFGCPIVPISARSGEGMEAWLSSLLESAGEDAAPPPSRALAQIDYDAYAAGEAALAWLNVTVVLQGRPTFAADRFLDALARALHTGCTATRMETAHVKAVLTTEAGHSGRLHLVGQAAEPDLPGAAVLGRARAGSLVLNARVHGAPATLDQITAKALAYAATVAGADALVASRQAFRPAYPRPTYRLPALA